MVTIKSNISQREHYTQQNVEQLNIPLNVQVYRPRRTQRKDKTECQYVDHIILKQPDLPHQTTSPVEMLYVMPSSTLSKRELLVMAE